MATKIILVSLDTSGNPAVILEVAGGASGRAVQASDGDTIKWQKNDNNDNFNIKDLTPTGNGEAFAPYTTGGSGQWLQSDYQPTNLNPYASFAYTLEVETPDNTTYDTTERAGVPTDNRPVIRN
jgi:hypothetical protein